MKKLLGVLLICGVGLQAENADKKIERVVKIQCIDSPCIPDEDIKFVYAHQDRAVEILVRTLKGRSRERTPQRELAIFWLGRLAPHSNPKVLQALIAKTRDQVDSERVGDYAYETLVQMAQKGDEGAKKYLLKETYRIYGIFTILGGLVDSKNPLDFDQLIKSLEPAKLDQK